VGHRFLGIVDPIGICGKTFAIKLILNPVRYKYKKPPRLIPEGFCGA
jgi:hypothetical protein